MQHIWDKKVNSYNKQVTFGIGQGYFSKFYPDGISLPPTPVSSWSFQKIMFKDSW